MELKETKVNREVKEGMFNTKDSKVYVAEQFATTRRKEFKLTDDCAFLAVFGQVTVFDTK